MITTPALACSKERSTGSGNHGIPANALGARLKMLRLRAGLKQSDLKTVQAASHISDHELGVIIPSLNILKKYAQFYGITVSELLDGVL